MVKGGGKYGLCIDKEDIHPKLEKIANEWILKKSKNYLVCINDKNYIFFNELQQKYKTDLGEYIINFDIHTHIYNFYIDDRKKTAFIKYTSTLIDVNEPKLPKHILEECTHSIKFKDDDDLITKLSTFIKETNDEIKSIYDTNDLRVKYQAIINLKSLRNNTNDIDIYQNLIDVIDVQKVLKFIITPDGYLKNSTESLSSGIKINKIDHIDKKLEYEFYINIDGDNQKVKCYQVFTTITKGKNKLIKEIADFIYKINTEIDEIYRLFKNHEYDKIFAIIQTKYCIKSNSEIIGYFDKMSSINRKQTEKLIKELSKMSLKVDSDDEKSDDEETQLLRLSHKLKKSTKGRL